MLVINLISASSVDSPSTNDTQSDIKIQGFECKLSEPAFQTFSIIQPSACHKHLRNITTKQKHIQLLKKNDFIRIPVKNCKIHFETTIFKCTKSFWTPSQQKFVGKKSYNLRISTQKCDDIIKEKEYKDSHNENIHVFLNNNKGSINKFIYGSVADDNSCEGKDFFSYNRNNHYTNALLHAIVTVQVKVEEALLNLNTLKVKLSDGNEYPYADTMAISSENGQYFWNVENSITACDARRFTSLYTGLGTIMEELKDNTTLQTFLVSNNQTHQSFLLDKKSEILLCGIKTITTSSADLYLRYNDGQDFDITPSNNINILDISMIHFHTIRLLSVYNNMEENLQELYSNYKYDSCLAKHQLIQTIVSLISIAKPMEIPKILFNIDNAIAVQSGDTLSLIKCIPIDCYLRHTELCYAELPAFCNNEEVFLSPRNRLITKTGTVSQCSDILPNYFFINNQWISISGSNYSIVTNTPLDILSNNFEWKFIRREQLASGGIYSNKQLENFHKFIMERKEMQSTAANYFNTNEHSYEKERSLFIKFMKSDQGQEYFISSQLRVIQNWLNYLGKYSAQVIAILIIIKFITFIVDFTYNVIRTIYVYGFTWRLLFTAFNNINNDVINANRFRNYNPHSQTTDSYPSSYQTTFPIHQRTFTLPNEPIILLEGPSPTYARLVSTTVSSAAPAPPVNNTTV